MVNDRLGLFSEQRLKCYEYLCNVRRYLEPDNFFARPATLKIYVYLGLKYISREVSPGVYTISFSQVWYHGVFVGISYIGYEGVYYGY